MERFKRVIDPHGGPLRYVHEETGVTVRRFPFMWHGPTLQYAWGVYIPGQDQRAVEVASFVAAKEAALPLIEQIRVEKENNTV